MIKALHRANSWCGETHIQKAIYLLQSAGEVDLGYGFVLYKHGPYSFDLATDIASLRSANVIEFAFPVQGYGPSVTLTTLAERIMQSAQLFVRQFATRINFIAEWFGSHDVRYLERIATAFYVKQQSPREDTAGLAARIMSLKPHISEPDAYTALRELDVKLRGLAHRPAVRQ
jgi:uncharacterized protein YwgA